MIELVRIVLLFTMLAITSYLDFRYREVSDKYWLFFGVAGMTIYFFDWNERTSYDVLTIIITLVMTSIMWKFFPIGKADILAILTIGILLPTISGIVMIPIALFMGASVLAGITVISYNVILNTKDRIVLKHSPFDTFDESIIRRSLAFFLIHRKRKREKFSIPAEQIINGKRKFCLGVKNVESEFTNNYIFVESGTPLLPYMFAVYVFIIFIFS